MAFLRRRRAAADDAPAPEPEPAEPAPRAEPTTRSELDQMAAERLPRRMRPKLWARAEIAEHEAVLQLRPVADDLVAVLCIDLPSTVQNVRPEDVQATGRPVEELWECALNQLDDGEPVERVPFDDAGLVEIIASDSQFLAARVLDLESLTGPLGPHGALLALSHRHMLMLHTIEDGPTLLDAVDILIPVAARAYADGPGRLSPHLYWWHAGELERVPVDQDTSSITPPPAFVELLSTLSGVQAA